LLKALYATSSSEQSWTHMKLIFVKDIKESQAAKNKTKKKEL
jgi:hypothetical protein